jgi:hypothetical protein
MKLATALYAAVIYDIRGAGSLGSIVRASRFIQILNCANLRKNAISHILRHTVQFSYPEYTKKKTRVKNRINIMKP